MGRRAGPAGRGRVAFLFASLDGLGGFLPAPADGFFLDAAKLAVAFGLRWTALADAGRG